MFGVDISTDSEKLTKEDTKLKDDVVFEMNNSVGTDGGVHALDTSVSSNDTSMFVKHEEEEDLLIKQEEEQILFVKQEEEQVLFVKQEQEEVLPYLSFRANHGYLVRIEEGTDEFERKIRRLGDDSVDFDDVFSHVNKRDQCHAIVNFSADSSRTFTRKRFFGSRYDMMTIESNLDDSGCEPMLAEASYNTCIPSGAIESCARGCVEELSDINDDEMLGIKSEINKSSESSRDERRSSLNFDPDRSVLDTSLFTTTQIDSLKSDCCDLRDDEAYRIDEPIFCPLLSEYEIELSQRCLTLFCLLRNISFTSGNVSALSRNSDLVSVLGRLLSMLQTEGGSGDSKPSLSLLRWLDTVGGLREHCLVICTNIGGYLDLSGFSEAVCAPLLSGLLHWFLASSAEAVDPLPGSRLSPQRLALEALSKICVSDSNVDLVLATRPFSRVVLLLTRLVDLFRDGHLQVDWALDYL